MHIHPASPPQTLDDQAREHYIQRALALLDTEWMLDVLTAAVDIPSPTGQEAACAAYFAKVMEGAGLDSRLQPIDAGSANAVGVLGHGPGPSVLLFAPLDSATTGVPEEEVPWVGPALTPEHQPVARRDGDTVTGLAASNSKAHIVAGIAAAAAIQAAQTPLAGRIVIGLGAGGAPMLERPALGRHNAGLGVGCEHMLRQGVRADFAIVTKPGFTVQWEEPGLCWFRIRLHGVQSYAGRKHLVPDHNPLLRAARLIPMLEDWLQEYAREQSSGLITPQGVVGALQGGWPHKPAFTPAACDIYVDLRITPRNSPMRAWRDLSAALARMAQALGDPAPRIDCELIAAVDGPATAEDNWIVQSCIRAWEHTQGATHAPDTRTSGQTEAVILRRYGIPTARIGLPEHVLPNGERTMGVAHGPAMAKLAGVLARTFIDTCTRKLAEVGLS